MPATYHLLRNISCQFSAGASLESMQNFAAEKVTATLEAVIWKRFLIIVKFQCNKAITSLCQLIFWIHELLILKNGSHLKL